MRFPPNGALLVSYAPVTPDAYVVELLNNLDCDLLRIRLNPLDYVIESIFVVGLFGECAELLAPK